MKKNLNHRTEPMFLLMVTGTILLEMLPFTKSKNADYVYIVIGKTPSI